MKRNRIKVETIITMLREAEVHLSQEDKHASGLRWATFINMKGSTCGTIRPMVTKQGHLCKGG